MNKKIVTQDFSQNFFSKRKKQKQDFQSGITSTYIALLSMIAALFLYYVWTLNANANSGYDIQDLQNQRRQLEMDKQQLDVEIASLESLERIMNEEHLEDMEKVKEPDFLVIKENTQYVYND